MKRASGSNGPVFGTFGHVLEVLRPDLARRVSFAPESSNES